MSENPWLGNEPENTEETGGEEPEVTSEGNESEASAEEPASGGDDAPKKRRGRKPKNDAPALSKRTLAEQEAGRKALERKS